MDSARLVYSWVQRTRQPLFRHLETLSREVYTQPTEVLAGESIRDRHVHIAQCYQAWIGQIGLGEPDLNAKEAPDAYPDLAAVRTLFQDIDALVERFMYVAGEHVNEPMSRTFHGKRILVTPRWLIAHPVTHEFHHKGQIVVALRLLGHPMTEDSDLALPLPLDGDPS